MQRFFALIGILIIFAGAGYFYVTKKQGQDPEKIFEKAVSLSQVEQAKALIEEKVKNWEPDPEDPEIRLPKNWGRSEITTGTYTYKVFSPDVHTPPAYYISFEFPKELVKKTVLIKCWGTEEKKATDICIVGNNPKLEAYFKIMKFLQAPSWEAITPHVEM